MKVRFPDVAKARPHYESVYCALVHPTEPEALWVRTTVQKRPGKDATGALWVTWFSPAGVRATKLNDLPASPSGHGLSCGPASQGPSGTRGSVESDSLSARWDLAFAPRTRALEHLHSAFLYRAPLPRTKATSPVPDLDFEGTLVLDGTPVDLTGWTGMLGHNWGTEHAARWIWLRACGFGDDGAGWLDAVLGRVRVGPALAPWTAFGALELDGTRHRLGGLLARGTSVTLADHGATIGLAGAGVSVRVRAEVSLAATVGWEYSDPGGHRHEVVNSSVADISLAIDRGKSRDDFHPVRRGVLEVGGDRRAFDVALQPFPD
ncbi:hypothetical protein A5658_13595 [Mycobacterium sp. 1245111.1]|uniref:hypothetical protein n=1 Tax=Mycobacterium sp. 1245111.1 TaxID=1834073 RepID=UPI0007FD82F5|nr:hypothetical protein [Mycobacterium sp. 1245111.1]OBK33263.1 hypothetical protein A5658_13595 [Mycobacterium sp. 1245111.1]